MRQVKKFGQIRDIPDARDHIYNAPRHIMEAVQPRVDLRSLCPPVYDQGNLGSCTANSIAAAMEFERMRQKLTVFVPSRLYIYQYERFVEGTVDSDSGAQLRDGIKVVNKYGAPPETEQPYSDNTTQFIVKPPASLTKDALADHVVKYASVPQTLAQFQACLSSGFPIVGGFSVYDSFMSDTVAKTGVVPMPDLNNESLQGGHAILIVGYDNHYQRFLVRNSWGTGWGIAGYFTVPYAYFLNPNLASDFWTIRSISLY